MKANAMLNASRVEELVQAIENAPVSTMGSEVTAEDICSAVQLSFGELAALVGENLKYRTMANVGTGLIATPRGSVSAEKQKGFYRRLKFTFKLTLGAPTGETNAAEIRKVGETTLQLWGRSLMREIEELCAEIEEKNEKKEKAAAN